MAASESDLRRRLDETARELECVRAENERLRALLALAQPTQAIIASAKGNGRACAERKRATVDSGSAAVAKVALIRDLFRGRDDVYALRWENARTDKSGYVPAVAGGWGGERNGPKTLPFAE